VEIVTFLGKFTLGTNLQEIDRTSQMLVILRNNETQTDTVYKIDGVGIDAIQVNTTGDTEIFIDRSSSTIIVEVENNNSYTVKINPPNQNHQPYPVNIENSDDLNDNNISQYQYTLVNVPGSYQSEIGCIDTPVGVSGDWEPNCPQSAMEDLDSDGIYEFATNSIPDGDYEVKVALNGSWDLNYGLNGKRNGENIPFTVPRDNLTVTFKFDTTTNILTVNILDPNSISIDVPSNMADDAWFDSEIAVIRGQRFRLTSNGQIDIYPDCGVNNETQQVCSTMRFGPEGSEGIGAADATYPIPGAYVGALIARIGRQGSPFLVANGGEFIANGNGTLQFRINDYYLEDNVGVFTVIFERILQ